MSNTIFSLPTPCALVDLDRVRANTTHMLRRIQERGATLRPHVKTHKCVEAALLQCGGQIGPITVSTLAEARGFAQAGFKDITYAVPIIPSRFHDVAALGRHIQLHTLVDNRAVVHAMEEFATANEVRFSVFLKVDCGYHRAGVDPHSPEAIDLVAALVRSSTIEFQGLLTHAGHAYDCRSANEIVPVAEQEREVIVALAKTCRESGLAFPTVSIGSTPTASVVENLDGVDEVRPGNYVFYDVFQSRIGSCTTNDIAFSVLSRVIGTYPQRNQVLIDAGALALSKDPGPTHVDDHRSFGVVVRPESGAIQHNWSLHNLSQEHGKCTIRGPQNVAVGDLIQIYPNHSCLTAALHPTFAVAQGTRLVDEWTPMRGW